MSIRMDENEIKDESASISLNSDGEIDESSSWRTMAESFCKLSLHGIMVPMNLFPDFWSKRHQKVQLNFPFVCNLKVDILYSRDLDLTSSRSEIINNDKWIDFYKNLCFILCLELKKSVSKRYWGELKKILIGISSNDIFKTVIKGV